MTTDNPLASWCVYNADTGRIIVRDRGQLLYDGPELQMPDDVRKIAEGMTYGPEALFHGPERQKRATIWALECFGPEVVADLQERSYRFFEEAGELIQSLGVSQEIAHKLVNYVYGRPVEKDPGVEVGGVLMTLAVLCSGAGIVMSEAWDVELDRCWERIEKIRAKQGMKRKYLNDPLPGGAGPQITAAELETLRGNLDRLRDELQDARSYVKSCSDRLPGEGILAVKIEAIDPPWIKAKEVTESGEWWYWDGNEDNAAVPVTIMRSGHTGNDYFACAGQLGWSVAQSLEALGGWWKKIPYPERPCDRRQ